jgi:hypothetical protein
MANGWKEYTVPCSHCQGEVKYRVSYSSNTVQYWFEAFAFSSGSWITVKQGNNTVTCNGCGLPEVMPDYLRSLLNQ